MNVIYPSEKRKFIVGEIVDINSPFILVTPYYPSDHLTNFPFKIISRQNVDMFKEDTKPYGCIVLDPELLYPKSSLFRNKYIALYEFLKRNKFREISVISSSFSKKTMSSFLRDIGSKNLEVKIFPEFSFEVSVIFTEDKLKELEAIDFEDRNLIICKTEYHSLFLYELFRKKFGKGVFVLRVNDFDYRKRVISDFIASGRVLIVPRKYRWFLRKVEFDRIVFLSLPKSIEEFLYFSSVFSSEKYLFLVSSSEEYKVSGRILKDRLLLNSYVEFLNFLGFKGDKISYLKGYLGSVKILEKNSEVDVSEDYRVIYNFFSNKYFEFEKGIEVLIGVNDWYLFFEYGKMRGVDRNYVRSLTNNLVSRGILGYKYFFCDKIIKKVY